MDAKEGREIARAINVQQAAQTKEGIEILKRHGFRVFFKIQRSLGKEYKVYTLKSKELNKSGLYGRDLCAFASEVGRGGIWVTQ